jgi:hypothetical protein
MTPKAYLNQAYRLEQRIRLDKEEIETLRALSTSVGSPGFEEHYNPNKATEAAFMKILEKVWKYEEKVSRELDLLLKLKTEIRKGQAVNDATLGGPVVVEDPKSNPAKDYKALYEEVMERIHAYERGETNDRQDVSEEV